MTPMKNSIVHKAIMPFKRRMVAPFLYEPDVPETEWAEHAPEPTARQIFESALIGIRVREKRIRSAFLLVHCQIQSHIIHRRPGCGVSPGRSEHAGDAIVLRAVQVRG